MRSAVELFETIRPDVVARAIEVRASIKLGLAAQAPEVAAAALDAVLDRMVGFLHDRDPERYRGFISRWAAFHLGEGFEPEDLIHSVVTLGDVVVQVARQRLPASDETVALVRDLVRMTHAMARLVVDVLGDELAGFDAGRTVVVR